MKRGRPKLYVTCDKIPGRWLVRELAAETGLTYEAIMSGIKRNRPVKGVMFRRETVKEFREWDCDFDWAWREKGDEVKEITRGSIDGESVKAFGLSIFRNDHFNDTEHHVTSMIAMALHRNPLRSALFAVCDEVIVKGWVK